MLSQTVSQPDIVSPNFINRLAKKKKLKSRVEGCGSRVVGRGARGSRVFSRYPFSRLIKQIKNDYYRDPQAKV